MILSGSAVHTKGLGSSLVSSRKRLMAVWRSTIERKTPRLRRRLVNLAKKPSTALSQGGRGRGEVERPARMALKPGTHPGVLVGRVIVEDDVDHLAGGDGGLDRIEKPDELLMAMALHAAPDDLAFEDVERGKQGRGAMPLVIVRHGRAAPFLHRQAGLGAVERLDLRFLID